MSKDFVAHLTGDGERVAAWRSIFGDSQIYIRSPFSVLANLPGIGEAAIYELDLELLTAEQRQRLVNHIANKFNVPADEVERDLDTVGCPILAEDVFVAVHNPQRWF